MTVKMVRGNECSNAKMLRDSPTRLREAVLAHLLTFVIRARQRLLEMDDCLASPAPPRRRRHTGGATWVDVRCRCERLRHYLKNPSTTLPAESSQRSALLFDRRPRSARAGRKCRAKNRITSTAHSSVLVSTYSRFRFTLNLVGSGAARVSLAQRVSLD